MLFVHQSNQLEVLARQFSQNYANAVDNPLATELIVTPNYPIERWLSLKLADQLGISANLEFKFPAEFSWSVLRTVIGELPETAPFSPGNLRWLIFSQLEHNAADYPELESYLANADQKRCFELASQIETVFDRYLFYRPGWIQDWESGHNADHWQARLWKKLVADNAAVHWVNLRQQFIQTLQASPSVLPQRVSFFAVSELSPGYLEMLGHLATQMDVHIYAVNPCQEYWSDIVPDKSILTAPEAVSEYLEAGNPLLASMGRQGRDFFDLILSLDSVKEQQEFISPEPNTLLSCVQRDVLELKEPDGYSEVEISADSIRIHSCHSLMREAEVIHDQILAELEADESLQPTDIVIMAPSIETAAPFIEAVFSTAENKIPYSISDVGLNTGNELAEALLVLLELPTSRYEVNRLLGFLELSAVRLRFGLDEVAVKNLGDWCAATNIRWGINAAQRESSGLPATNEHTWKNGLDRLLLGYMMNSDDFYHETLAYTEIEGSLAIDLGRFADLAEKLFSVSSWLDEKMLLSAWIEKINILIDAITLPSFEESSEREQLRSLLQNISNQSVDSGYDADLDFQCVRYLIQQEINNSTDSGKFMSDGVTVSRFTPMRNVPFKVVCLMGMNDKDFPNRQPKQSFDLAADEYWRGDRSARNSDRYLFLEAMLSARKKLVISYCGQDIKSNESRPPSVLVNELLDYIKSGYNIEAEKIIVKHPLQAFSPRYLDTDKPDSRLFTYKKFYHSVTETSDSGNIHFLDEDISIETETPLIIELYQLENFLKNPVRYFLQDIMGISLSEQLTDLAEREPFQLESFTDAKILQIITDDADEKTALEKLRALGLLPHGRPGEQLFKQQRELALTFLSRLPQLESPKTEHFEIKVGEYLLKGSLGNLYQNGQFIIQMNPVWASWRLPIWLRHLALCATNEESRQAITHVFTPRDDLEFTQVEQPLEFLETIIESFIQGRTRALKIFPKSGFEYAKSGKIANAVKAWEDQFIYAGEGSKPENQLAFRNLHTVLDEEFQQWSETLFNPLISHLQQ